MLLGSFYNIVNTQREDSTVKARIQFNPEHEIFKGHFPGNPIVPGVCQVQITEEILSKALGKTWKVKTASQIKFLSFINPEINPEVDIKLEIGKEEEGTIQVDTSCHWEQTVFLKFKGTFNEQQSN